jgi:hypothetical protein
VLDIVRSRCNSVMIPKVKYFERDEYLMPCASPSYLPDHP